MKHYKVDLRSERHERDDRKHFYGVSGLISLGGKSISANLRPESADLRPGHNN